MGLIIKKLKQKKPVYDITVNDNHNFYANNILVHNCQEINLPTTPFYDVNSDEGEIALCVLGAINLGKVKKLSDIENIAKHIVYTLNRVIDDQDYIVKAAEKMLKRRSIGVGVTNFAYWLAKNGLGYNKESLAQIDALFEHIQFYLLKASMELAKRDGACEYFDRTKYSKGLLPIDHYNKKVDELVDRKTVLEWEWLRDQIKKYGLRNSTLTAGMPCESSSLVSSSTSGFEPIRQLITMKVSKAGAPLPLVAPEINKLKNKYEKSFSFGNFEMNQVVSVMQKWFDQGLSVNHYYNKNNYENGDVPMSVIIKDILDFYKYGGKQLYYANSIDSSKKLEDVEEEKEYSVELTEEEKFNQQLAELGCEGGACSI